MFACLTRFKGSSKNIEDDEVDQGLAAPMHTDSRFDKKETLHLSDDLSMIKTTFIKKELVFGVHVSTLVKWKVNKNPRNKRVCLSASSIDRLDDLLDIHFRKKATNLSCALAASRERVFARGLTAKSYVDERFQDWYGRIDPAFIDKDVPPKVRVQARPKHEYKKDIKAWQYIRKSIEAGAATDASRKVVLHLTKARNWAQKQGATGTDLKLKAIFRSLQMIRTDCEKEFRGLSGREMNNKAAGTFMAGFYLGSALLKWQLTDCNENPQTRAAKRPPTSTQRTCPPILTLFHSNRRRTSPPPRPAPLAASDIGNTYTGPVEQYAYQMTTTKESYVHSALPSSALPLVRFTQTDINSAFGPPAIRTPKRAFDEIEADAQPQPEANDEQIGDEESKLKPARKRTKTIR